MKKRFYSRKDKLAIIGPLTGLLFILLYTLQVVFFNDWTKNPVGMVVFGYIFVSGMAVFIASPWYGTWYETDGTILKCRGGLVIRKDIPVANIHCVEKMHVKWMERGKAAALSRDVLRIRYTALTSTYNEFYISPENETTLIELLKQINPEIAVKTGS